MHWGYEKKPMRTLEKLTQRQQNACQWYHGKGDFEVVIDGWKGLMSTLLAYYHQHAYEKKEETAASDASTADREGFYEGA